jgi:hypothetical protein
VAHLKELVSLFQSHFTVLQQCAHFCVAEISPEFAAILLCLDKGVNPVKGSE